jgi:hypothetical protein
MVLVLVLLLLVVLLGSLMFLTEGGTWYSPEDNCSVNGEDPITCREAGYPEGAYLRLDLMQQSLGGTPFLSIFDACWYTITTISTVGYGDLYPTSTGGRTIGMGCMVLGILAMAMPITVLGTNFDAQFEQGQIRDKVSVCVLSV